MFKVNLKLSDEEVEKIKKRRKLLQKLIEVFKKSSVWGSIPHTAYELAYGGVFASKANTSHQCKKPIIGDLVANEDIGFLLLMEKQKLNIVALVSEESFSETTAREIIAASKKVDQHIFGERCLECTANALLQLGKAGMFLGEFILPPPIERDPKPMAYPYKDA